MLCFLLLNSRNVYFQTKGKISWRGLKNLLKFHSLLFLDCFWLLVPYPFLVQNWLLCIVHPYLINRSSRFLNSLFYISNIIDCDAHMHMPYLESLYVPVLAFCIFRIPSSQHLCISAIRLSSGKLRFNTFSDAFVVCLVASQPAGGVCGRAAS